MGKATVNRLKKKNIYIYIKLNIKIVLLANVVKCDEHKFIHLLAYFGMAGLI